MQNPRHIGSIVWHASVWEKASLGEAAPAQVCEDAGQPGSLFGRAFAFIAEPRRWRLSPQGGHLGACKQHSSPTGTTTYLESLANTLACLCTNPGDGTSGSKHQRELP
jgi:hypothetical protein